MKIDHLAMTNFMGIKGRMEFDMPHLAAIIGPNGMGKTTVMNAVRYGLTGAEPEGDIINKSAQQSTVTITLTDAKDGVTYDFTRIKDRDKPSKCQIDGKSTTQKTMNQKIEDIIGISLDKIKVLASSDVVAAMKPQEFSSFILDYIPEKLTLEKVMEFIPEATLGMIEVMEANLPEEGIDMDVINEFDSVCRYNRKDLKDVLERKKALYETKPHEEPGTSKEELEKRIKECSDLDSAYEVYMAKKSVYDKAVESAAKHESMLKDLEAQITAIEADRPDPAVYDRLRKEGDSIRESISNQKIAISSVSTAIRQLEASLASLETPTCPLSDKIVCHQDKTAAKNELIESINSSKEGFPALEAELKKAEDRLEENEAAKKEYQDNFNLYDKKITLKKQYKSLSDAKPELPAKPEEVAKPETAEEMRLLEQQLKAINDYAEGVELASQIALLENQLKDYEALVKALAEKGAIRTGIISSYLSVFEDLCNERSSKVRPEITFEFVSKDGVVVLMDNGKGSKLPYSSLSGGEKAYMIFIIMDMLNSLCGSNILLLDELSVVDTKCFDALLEIVLAYAGDYDHILLAAVDHDDTVRSVESRGISTLDLKAHEVA